MSVKSPWTDRPDISDRPFALPPETPEELAFWNYSSYRRRCRRPPITFAEFRKAFVADPDGAWRAAYDGKILTVYPNGLVFAVPDTITRSQPIPSSFAFERPFA